METKEQELYLTPEEAAGTVHPHEVVSPIPFRPLHNQVVIRVLREEEKIGMIYLPEAANDNKQHSAIGMIVAKGVGHRRKSNHFLNGPNPYRPWLEGYCPMPVEPGDYVVFARSSGEAHEFAGQTYLVTPVEHVYAVLDEYEVPERMVATEREFGMEAHLDKTYKRPASERPRVEGKHS